MPPKKDFQPWIKEEEKKAKKRKKELAEAMKELEEVENESFRRVTERAKRENDSYLKQMAHSDKLTSLYNKREDVRDKRFEDAQKRLHRMTTRAVKHSESFNKKKKGKK